MLQEGVKTGISSIRDKVKEFNQDIKEVKKRATQAGAAEQYVTVNTRDNQSANPLERLASGLFGAPRSASNNRAAEEIFDMPWLRESSAQSQGRMMEVPSNQPSQAQPHNIDLSNSARTMDGRPASEVLPRKLEFNSVSITPFPGIPDQARKDELCKPEKAGFVPELTCHTELRFTHLLHLLFRFRIKRRCCMAVEKGR